MCDVLCLINDVSDDVANAQPAHEPMNVPDKYGLLRANEIAENMRIMCGVDIGVEARHMARVMTHETEDEANWYNLSNMVDMRCQLWQIISLYTLRSKSGIADAVYEKVALWKPDPPRSAIRDALLRYHIELYQTSVLRMPDIPVDERSDRLRDIVTLLFYKALQYAIDIYKEWERREMEMTELLPF